MDDDDDYYNTMIDQAIRTAKEIGWIRAGDKVRREEREYTIATKMP